MVASQRPRVVTILAVLAIIAGAVYLLFGAVAILGSSSISDTMTYEEGVPTSAGTLVVTGILFIILSLLNFVFGFGAMSLKPLAWRYGIGLQIFNIISGLFSLPGSIIAIVISGLVLYYLFRPNVKRIFGKA